MPVMTAPDARPGVSADNGQLVKVLASMPMSDPAYGAWWDTQTGRWLYAEIKTRIGEPLAALLRHRFGVSNEAADVANTAFTILRKDFVHTYILRADDPWAYLSQILKRDIVSAAGAYFRVELTDEAMRDSSVRQRQMEPSAVSIHDAVELTYELLAPSFPENRRGSLKEAILYFAELGGARLSHIYTHATSDAELTGLGLVREEILAIANAVLGSRPNNGQTSLVAAFLNDPAFDPRSSILHRRALNKFQARVAGTATKQEALVG